MSDRKKILVFIDWYLPGYKAGGPIQSCSHLIEQLQDTFDFSVITRNTDYCETIPYPSIKSNQWNLLNGTRVYYFSKDQLNKKNIQKLLEEEKYDWVYLNGIFSFYFTLLPLYILNKKKEKKTIVASRGMLANSALQIKKGKKSFFLGLSKLIGLFNNVTFHATNDNEKEDILSTFTNAKVMVAPNLPQKNNLTENPTRIKKQNEIRLVSVARISPEKNLKYALEILQKVKATVKFDIYGPVYNVEYWEECKSIIAQLPSHITVEYKNSIESDLVNNLLTKYHCLFMPTRGENFGHIILQALSNGCPVIISDQTPWKNLELQNCGVDISLSQPLEFCKAIEKIAAQSQEEYNKMSNAAFLFAHTFTQNHTAITLNKQLFS